MNRTRVLVVEDDASMQEFYDNFFTVLHEGRFIWQLAATGEQALDWLARNTAEVIILDWSLPGISGLETLRRIRAGGAARNALVFMVTAKAGRRDCVAGLEAGADDYLAKPVYADELLARLNSLLRRQETRQEEPRIYELEGLRLAVATGDASHNGRRARLAPKESALLEVFLRRPNVIHSPCNLWDMVWGYQSKRWKHTLVAHMSALKKTLGPWGRRLESRYGKGYLLNAGSPVLRSGELSRPSPPASIS